MITIALTIFIAAKLPLPLVKREFRHAGTAIERDLHVRLEPRFRRRAMPRPDLSRQTTAVDDYAAFAAKSGERTFLILQPGLTETGLPSSTGQAAICGRLGLIGFAPRFEWMRFTLAHELGHMLGATHSDPDSLEIMNPDPIWANTLRFSDNSRLEVEGCV